MVERLVGAARTARDGRARLRARFAAGWNAYLRRTGATGCPTRAAAAPVGRPIRASSLSPLLPARGAHLRRRAAGGDGRCRAARRRAGGDADHKDSRRGSARSAPTATRSAPRGAPRRRAAALQHALPVRGATRAGTSCIWKIPGEINAIGAALQGMPVVNLGFNRRIAWTGTSSKHGQVLCSRRSAAPGPEPGRYQQHPLRQKLALVRPQQQRRHPLRLRWHIPCGSHRKRNNYRHLERQGWPALRSFRSRSFPAKGCRPELPAHDRLRQCVSGWTGHLHAGVNPSHIIAIASSPSRRVELS